MLQQILDLNHIDPDLLAELPDDLKQVLFFKMRQRQVEKWLEWDERWTLGELRIEENGKRHIRWALDENGDVMRLIFDLSQPPPRQKETPPTSSPVESDDDMQWRESEAKAKEAEREMRERGAQARKRSRTLTPKETQLILQYLLKAKQGQPDRPVRPGSKEDVVRWFRDQELPRRSPFLSSGQIAPWFHGLVSRPAAEKLLESAPANSFLVRVSERIWGYCITYRSDQECKHFLVDAAQHHYQIIGDNQPHFSSLERLVEYYSSNYISFDGKELLKLPMGQSSGAAADYAELLLDMSQPPPQANRECV